MRSALAVAVLVIAAGTARGDDGLAWSADHCGSVTALRARIAVHLGRPLAAEDAIRADVEVTAAPLGGDVRALLAIETRQGRAAREVHGANCAAVVDAVAFVLASAVTEGEVPDRPVSPQVVADAVVPWVVRPQPVPVPERPSGVHVSLSLDGWSDAGTLPQLRLGVGGSLAVMNARYRGELGASTWQDGWAPLSDPASGMSGVSMRGVTGRGCYGVWRLWLCSGVLYGRLRGLPGGGETPQADWWAGSFQTLWSRPVAGPVRVAGSIEGLVSVVRPEFVLGGGTIRHRPAPFALRLGLALAVTVW